MPQLATFTDNDRLDRVGPDNYTANPVGAYFKLGTTAPLFVADPVEDLVGIAGETIPADGEFFADGKNWKNTTTAPIVIPAAPDPPTTASLAAIAGIVEVNEVPGNEDVTVNAGTLTEPIDPNNVETAANDRFSANRGRNSVVGDLVSWPSPGFANRWRKIETPAGGTTWVDDQGGGSDAVDFDDVIANTTSFPTLGQNVAGDPVEDGYTVSITSIGGFPYKLVNGKTAFAQKVRGWSGTEAQWAALETARAAGEITLDDGTEWTFTDGTDTNKTTMWASSVGWTLQDGGSGAPVTKLAKLSNTGATPLDLSIHAGLWEVTGGLTAVLPAILGVNNDPNAAVTDLQTFSIEFPGSNPVPDVSRFANYIPVVNEGEDLVTNWDTAGRNTYHGWHSPGVGTYLKHVIGTDSGTSGPKHQFVTESAAVAIDAALGDFIQMDYGGMASVLAFPTNVEAGDELTFLFKRTADGDDTFIPSFDPKFVFLDGVVDFASIAADERIQLEFNAFDDGGTLKLYEGSGVATTGGTDPLATCLATVRVNPYLFYDFNLPDTQDVDADAFINAVEDRSGNGRHLIPQLDAAGFYATRDTVESIEGTAFQNVTGNGNHFLKTSAAGDDVASFDGNTSFSVMFWCFRDDLTNADSIAGRITSTTNSEWRIICNSLAAGPSVQMSISKDGTLAGNTTVTSSNVMSAATWHHVCARWDHVNSTLSIILDGDFTAPIGEIVDATLNGNIFQSTAVPLRVGKGRSDAINGRIDQFGIWNRLLSQCEIEAARAEGLAARGLFA